MTWPLICCAAALTLVAARFCRRRRYVFPESQFLFCAPVPIPLDMAALRRWTLEDIARAFGVPLEYILDGEAAKLEHPEASAYGELADRAP